jgi:hypothetical protein
MKYDVILNGDWLGEMEWAELLETIENLGIDDKIEIRGVSL